MADLGERERALLEDAAAWRVIGLTFERPRGDWAETILAITGARTLDQRVTSLASRAVDEGSEAKFLAAFGPGGAVSPREVSYRFMGDPGRILAELRMMYDTFSYMPRTEEPPDHVSVEAGFVGFLRLKEAYSLMMRDEEVAIIIRDAAALFVREHLAFLTAGLCEGTLDGYLRDGVDALVERVGTLPTGISARTAVDEFSDCAGGCSFDPD